MCVGPSAKPGAPPNSRERGAEMHSGVLAKSQASSTAGSWQLSHRIERRQRTSPLHAGVSQNSSLHLIPRPSALDALSLIISTFLSAFLRYCHLGSFCCLADVGCASALVMEQKPESWLYPGSEFVQTCTTILDNALRAMV